MRIGAGFSVLAVALTASIVSQLAPSSATAQQNRQRFELGSWIEVTGTQTAPRQQAPMGGSVSLAQGERVRVAVLSPSATTSLLVSPQRQLPNALQIEGPMPVHLGTAEASQTSTVLRIYEFTAPRAGRYDLTVVDRPGCALGETRLRIDRLTGPDAPLTLPDGSTAPTPPTFAEVMSTRLPQTPIPEVVPGLPFRTSGQLQACHLLGMMFSVSLEPSASYARLFAVSLNEGQRVRASMRSAGSWSFDVQVAAAGKVEQEAAQQADVPAAGTSMVTFTAPVTGYYLIWARFNMPGSGNMELPASYDFEMTVLAD